MVLVTSRSRGLTWQSHTLRNFTQVQGVCLGRGRLSNHLLHSPQRLQRIQRPPLRYCHIHLIQRIRPPAQSHDALLHSSLNLVCISRQCGVQNMITLGHVLPKKILLFLSGFGCRYAKSSWTWDMMVQVGAED